VHAFDSSDSHVTHLYVCRKPFCVKEKEKERVYAPTNLTKQAVTVLLRFKVFQLVPAATSLETEDDARFAYFRDVILSPLLVGIHRICIYIYILMYDLFHAKINFYVCTLRKLICCSTIYIPLCIRLSACLSNGL
jgi:hypothetical protein